MVCSANLNCTHKPRCTCEARVGNGIVLATTLDLDASVPGQQLRRSLLDYRAADRRQPSLCMNADEKARQLSGNRSNSSRQPI